MTAIAPPRARARPPRSGLVASLLRSRRLVQRNLLVYKRGWMVIFSGFFEPLFYLLGIGYGLGSLIGERPAGRRAEIPYAAFVAPALLAQATMNGAIAESIFNVFFKLNFSKTYDAILATPLGIREIAVGEMLWSLFRGTLYVLAFVLVMLGMGLVISPMALPRHPRLDPHRRRLQRGLPGDHRLPAHGAGLRPADGPGGDADVPLQRHLLPDQRLPRSRS